MKIGVKILSLFLAFALILGGFESTWAFAATDMNREQESGYRDSGTVIMTYNILTTSKISLTATNLDGSMTRGQMLIDLINQELPDTIGLNEVTGSWLSYLESDVVTHTYSSAATYAIAGLKSSTNTTLISGSSEYSPILYRSDKYDLETEGGYWFSETPAVYSKYGDIKDSYGNVKYTGMKFERIYSYVVLKYKGTNKIAYIHIQAHYDQMSSDYINTLCSKQIATKANELAAQYQCPITISGDLNANEDSQAYKYLANGSNGYVDAKYLTDQYSSLATCPGYGEDYNAAATTAIDHVFVSNGNIGVYKHDVIPNQYLSDHSCVYTKLSLNSEPVLDGIKIDGNPIQNFSPTKYAYTAYTDSNRVDVCVKAASNSRFFIDGEEVESVPAENGFFEAVTSLELQDGNNEHMVCVEDESEVRTVYSINAYKNYGQAKPIISEIFPNADQGYKYFEVSNRGTRSFNTSDYYFLWGNITDDTTRTWEGKFDPDRNVEIGPNQTVVFWFTNGFSGTPTVDDFNDKYGTDLTDDEIVISSPDKTFNGYINGLISKTYTMGGTTTRGMRIAKACDEHGTTYSWVSVSSKGDALFNGPTVSVSSYNGLSSASLTSTQLYKFKYVESKVLTASSDLLSSSYATPGVYDTILGNETRDAFTKTEGEDYFTSGIATAENTVLAGTKKGSWAFYSNVMFGNDGAASALFNGAVKGSNASGRIDIYIDGTMDGDLTHATLVGSRSITPTSDNDWNTFQTFYCDLNKAVMGTHNVILKFIPDSSKTYVINLDYFQFQPIVKGNEITSVNSFAFSLDGEQIGPQGVTKDASPSHSKFILKDLTSYSPADAAYSVNWVSNNTNVAAIDNTNGTITVMGPGCVTFTANVLSNRNLFQSFVSPTVTFTYKVDAFGKVECEWVDSFTNGKNHVGETASANLQKASGCIGISDSFKDNFNIIGNTVNGSTAKYKFIDFGSGNLTDVIFNMALKTGKCAGTIEIYLANDDGSPGSKIGYCSVSDPTDGGAENYSTYKTFHGVILDGSITGIHDIVLKFVTNTYYVANIDYFTFTNLNATGNPPAPTKSTTPQVPIISTASRTFLSDTNQDFRVNCSYQFKITSKNGFAPFFVIGTPGVFNYALIKTVGNDYYYRITAIGDVDSKAGIYVNGTKVLVATVGADFISDTTLPFNVKMNASYVFKVTADAKPKFVAGTSSVFKTEIVKSTGRDYFFRVTAVGKACASCGFYINSQERPVAVATITKQ